MSETPEDTLPEWVKEFRRRQEEENARFPDHPRNEDGDHDEESCYDCLLTKEVRNKCDCGECCRRLLIEVLPQDAEREPKIKELASPILDPPDENGHRELIGWFLNNSKEHMGCVFLDLATNKCTVYETRPLTCRLYDCDGDGREQLIDLGILKHDE